MRSIIRLAGVLVAFGAGALGATFSYHVAGDEPGSWPRILSSVGLTSKATGPVGVFVVRGTSPLSSAQWLERVDKGAFLILEGETEIAASLGFKAGAKRVVVRGVEDVHAPKLQIVWISRCNCPCSTSRLPPRCSRASAGKRRP